MLYWPCTICYNNNNNNFCSSCTRGGECAAVAAGFSALLVSNGTEHKTKNENNRMKMQPTSQTHGENEGLMCVKLCAMYDGWELREFHCVAAVASLTLSLPPFYFNFRVFVVLQSLFPRLFDACSKSKINTKFHAFSMFTFVVQLAIMISLA